MVFSGALRYPPVLVFPLHGGGSIILREDEVALAPFLLRFKRFQDAEGKKKAITKIIASNTCRMKAGEANRGRKETFEAPQQE